MAGIGIYMIDYDGAYRVIAMHDDGVSPLENGNGFLLDFHDYNSGDYIPMYFEDGKLTIMEERYPVDAMKVVTYFDEPIDKFLKPYIEEYNERYGKGDMEESRRPRGRMLRESSTAMPVDYVIGRELFDGKWWPIIVYLNQSPDRYWYEAVCADEGGVYHTELGNGYLSRIRPGTDKCAPEVVDAVEDEFFGQFAVDDIPTHRVDTIEDLERYAPADKRLISRD